MTTGVVTSSELRTTSTNNQKLQHNDPQATIDIHAEPAQGQQKDTSDTVSTADDHSLGSGESGSHNQSQDIWLLACEQRPADTTTDSSMHSVNIYLEDVSAVGNGAPSAAPTLSTTMEGSSESLSISSPLKFNGRKTASVDGQATDMDSNDDHNSHLDSADPRDATTELPKQEEEEQADPVSATPADLNQQPKQEEQEGDCSIAASGDDEDSAILHSDRSFRKPNKESTENSRLSSVTFAVGDITPTSSSEFLSIPSQHTNLSSDSSSARMTASERWRDDSKAQALPSVERKISLMVNGDFPPSPAERKISRVAKGDFSPSIPRREPLDEDEHGEREEQAVAIQPKKSILKASVDEEIFVRVDRRYWKKLPPPDMDTIKLTRQQMLDVLQQTQEEQEEQQQQQETEDPSEPLKIVPERSERSSSDVGGDDGDKTNKIVFEKIYIREYQQTIGDNPSVSYGTPISLDWPYMDTDPLDLDVYESKKTRRTMRQMFLNHYQRKNILIHKYGHSVAEVKAAKYATNKVRSQRNVSKMMQTNLQPLLVLEEMRESAVRKAKRRMSGGNNNTTSTRIVDGASSTGSQVSSSEFEGQQEC